MMRGNKAFIQCCQENNIPYFDKEIDLRVQDLPHPHSKIEWWYFNTHFHEKVSLKKYSFFFSFFKVKTQNSLDENQFIIYVLVDHTTKIHQHWAIWDEELPKQYSKRIREKNTDKIALLDYLADMMDQNREFYPDVSRPIDFEVNEENFAAHFGESRFFKKDGLYCIEINHDSQVLYFEFCMDKKTIRHGQEGITLFGGYDNVDRMFYYFIPQGSVKGRLNNKEIEGIGWYDHEFSLDNKESTKAIGDKGWIWFSVQLEDGRQLSIYQVFNKGTAEVVESIAKVIDETGNYKTYTHLSIEALDTWQSNRTLNTYPVKWQIKLDECDAELYIEALFDNQEVITILTAFAFYEGVINIRYRENMKETEGVGFVEIYGNNEKILRSKTRLMEEMAGLVVNEINRYYLPERASDIGMTLVRDEQLQRIINGVSAVKIYDAGVNPLRDMLVRKGKSWRSFFCLVVINAVGGNSEQCREWPVIAEILQSSTLIFDDIQDNSKLRRGKPTVHELYGMDRAINGGLLGYFLFNRLMNTTDLTPEQLLKIYKIYFDTAVSSIVGQCADIAGMQDLLLQAVDQGDNTDLLKAIEATHNLKTGLNIKSLAEIGAILGHASEQQVTQVGHYALNVGLAYQYMDDVRAYRGDARALEEDVMSGKITIPIALAIPQLDASQRRWLYESLIHKKREALHQVVVLLNEIGVIDHCVQTAKNLVAEGWKAVEPVIRDSLYKAMLYYVGIYALEVTAMP